MITTVDNLSLLSAPLTADDRLVCQRLAVKDGGSSFTIVDCMFGKYDLAPWWGSVFFFVSGIFLKLCKIFP